MLLCEKVCIRDLCVPPKAHYNSITTKCILHFRNTINVVVYRIYLIIVSTPMYDMNIICGIKSRLDNYFSSRIFTN